MIGVYVSQSRGLSSVLIAWLIGYNHKLLLSPVLKNGYVPGDDMVLRKPAKRKYRSPAGEGNKQMKTSTLKPLARAWF